MQKNNNPAVAEGSFTTGKLEDLHQLIEKMIRNPDGEAVYFGSTKGLKSEMDRKHGTDRYV